MGRRMEKIQRELIERYDNISNLYVAYMNSGKFPDEFGREFFHAVGDIIQGVPVKQLTLFHLDSTAVEGIVDHTVSKGGVPGPIKKSSQSRPTQTKSSKRRKNLRRNSR
jgi:hypothetical protein